MVPTWNPYSVTESSEESLYFSIRLMTGGCHILTAVEVIFQNNLIIQAPLWQYIFIKQIFVILVKFYIPKVCMYIKLSVSRINNYQPCRLTPR